MDVLVLELFQDHAIQMVFVLASQTLLVTSALIVRLGFMAILIVTVRFKIMFHNHKYNFFVHPFIACGCSSSGASSTSCTSSGVCTCKSNFVGDKCTSCNAGFYDYPNCYCKVQDNIS